MTPIEDVEDDLWSAIGDPMRRRLLDLLLRERSGTATTLSSELPVTRQAVSKHLDVLVRAGLVLEVAGLAALGLVAWFTDANWWLIAVALFLYGIGVGLATAQVTNVVLAEIPENEGGQGSGIQSTFRQLGSALGIAVLTTVTDGAAEDEQVTAAPTATHQPARSRTRSD